jgi:hypothetical protein
MCSLSSTDVRGPCPYFPHDLVNSIRRQRVRFFFQLGTPCGQDSVLARIRWCETEFVGNLPYRRFPGIEIHRSIPCDVCPLETTHVRKLKAFCFCPIKNPFDPEGWSNGWTSFPAVAGGGQTCRTPPKRITPPFSDSLVAEGPFAGHHFRPR